jgi:hypothetical protein
MQVQQSTEYNHVEWLELKPGQLIECAVLKTDEHGNKYFFPLNELDEIDRRRLFQIITSRHAATMALWDLMDQKTLGNGMNALVYFHQLVKLVTPDAKIINPRAGVIGRTAGTSPAPIPAPTGPTSPAE